MGVELSGSPFICCSVSVAVRFDDLSVEVEGDDMTLVAYSVSDPPPESTTVSETEPSRTKLVPAPCKIGSMSSLMFGYPNCINSSSCPPSPPVCSCPPTRPAWSKFST